MVEKLIIFIMIVLFYFDYRTVKQDIKTKKIYRFLCIPAIYLLYSYVFGKNLPNLDELFYYTIGSFAEKVISWLQVK